MGDRDATVVGTVCVGCVSVEVVRFAADPYRWRFCATFSVREAGKFWMISNGSRRRAWSTAHAAKSAALAGLLLTAGEDQRTREE